MSSGEVELKYMASNIFRTVILLAVAFVELSGASSAQDAKRLLIGKPLLRAYDQRNGVSFENSPARKVIAELQATTGISVILDRRIDPSQSISFTTSYQTNRVIIDTLAKELDAAASFTDFCVYVGPEANATNLRTLIELVLEEGKDKRAILGRDAYMALTTKSQTGWPRLSRPSTLLASRAEQLGLPWASAATVPHDLWNAASFGSISFIEFATVVLIQFDKTLSINDGGELVVRPMPAAVSIEQRHRVPSRERGAIQQRWSRHFPELDVTWRSSTATVVATMEIHDKLKALSKGGPSEVAAAGLKTRLFTVGVPEGTQLGQLVATFRQSGIAVRFEGISDSEVNQLLSKTTSFNVTESPGTDFFPMAFKPLGATVDVTDEEVIVRF